MARFVADPARITAPDPPAVAFDLGRPQPLFELYMTYPEAYQAALSEIQRIVSRDDPPAIYYLQRQ